MCRHEFARAVWKIAASKVTGLSKEAVLRPGGPAQALHIERLEERWVLSPTFTGLPASQDRGPGAIVHVSAGRFRGQRHQLYRPERQSRYFGQHHSRLRLGRSSLDAHGQPYILRGRRSDDYQRHDAVPAVRQRGPEYHVPHRRIGHRGQLQQHKLLSRRPQFRWQRFRDPGRHRAGCQLPGRDQSVLAVHFVRHPGDLQPRWHDQRLERLLRHHGVHHVA